MTLTDALLLTKGKHDLNIGGEVDLRATTASTRIRTRAASGRSRPTRRSIAPTRRRYPFQFTIREHGIYEHNGGADRRVHLRHLSREAALDAEPRHPVGLRHEPARQRHPRPDARRTRGSRGWRSSSTRQGSRPPVRRVPAAVGATWDIRGDGTLVARGGYGVYITRNREWFSVAARSRSTRQLGAVHRPDQAGAVLSVDQLRARRQEHHRLRGHRQRPAAACRSSTTTTSSRISGRRAPASAGR